MQIAGAVSIDKLIEFFFTIPQSFDNILCHFFIWCLIFQLFLHNVIMFYSFKIFFVVLRHGSKKTAKVKRVLKTN